MSSNYPSGYDTFPTPGTATKLQNETLTHSQLHAALGLAIEALQQTLGINPHGSYNTVAERLAQMQTILTGMDSTLDSVSEIIATGSRAEFETDTYTPSLTGMVIGTGGGATNTADYTFIGGPNTSDPGIMHITGTILFGTSGQTFPTAPTIALPSGFSHTASANTSRPCGMWQAVDASASENNRLLPVFISTGTTLRPLLGGDSSQVNTLSTTTPFTWASGDAIYWNATLPVLRG